MRRFNSASDVEVYADRTNLARAEAERIVSLAAATVAERGRCSLALAGGSTPRALYELLATPPFAAQIDWQRLHVFWGDERCVAPDHPASNYRMVRAALLDHVPIPEANIHRIAGEDEPQAAAFAYEKTLHDYFDTVEVAPRRSFDLALLGMGGDGHTASLFPGTPPVTEERRWVMENHVPSMAEPWRITLTPVVLNAAAAVTFVVTGTDKAERLRDALEIPERSPLLPVQRIRPRHGALTWMIDEAAAAQLRKGERT